MSEYKDKLSEAAFSVCRLGTTEQPFSGKYNDHWLTGHYHCVCCDNALFSSEDKFNAGCGWPSFSNTLKNSNKIDNVAYLNDKSHGMNRIEIQCQNCQSHLGHVFDDGPAPTYKRYCVNSLSLTFKST